jgi:hypothetical protein
MLITFATLPSKSKSIDFDLYNMNKWTPQNNVAKNDSPADAAA